MRDRYTKNFSNVKKWIESHGGFPVVISGVTDEDTDRPLVMDIAFDPNNTEVERIEWEEFFDWFERENLALRYNNDAEGYSAFELVDRDRVRSELEPELEAIDSGDPDVLRQNTIHDAE
ncbi:MAG: hypothetical protein OQJ98_00285 [Candidatus Pacebacteria bacterium]|nr:hypothetical protein [Candidatus Paceibacterota bacterium]